MVWNENWGESREISYNPLCVWVVRNEFDSLFFYILVDLETLAKSKDSKSSEVFGGISMNTREIIRIPCHEAYGI